MDRTYIAIAILATTSTSACTTWRVLDDKVSLRLSALARAKPARDELPGTPHLLDDGRIAYAVDLDAACVDITYFDRVHALTRRRRLTTLGAVVILTGVALTSVAAPVSAGAVAFALGMTGAGMVLGTAVQLPSRHDASDHDERVERDAVVHANPARCQDVRLFGALRLTTPWGEHATAALDDDGVARFAVDWRGADDNAPQRRWKVFASTPHTSAEFVLAAADQSGATARIDAARR
jgi:hypothetical protein